MGRCGREAPVEGDLEGQGCGLRYQWRAAAQLACTRSGLDGNIGATVTLVAICTHEPRAEHAQERPPRKRFYLQRDPTEMGQRGKVHVGLACRVGLLTIGREREEHGKRERVLHGDFKAKHFDRRVHLMRTRSHAYSPARLGRKRHGELLFYQGLTIERDGDDIYVPRNKQTSSLSTRARMSII